MTDHEAYDLISSLAAAGNACWVWTGRRTPRGKPVLHVDEEHELAHRAAYRLWRAKGHALAGVLRPHVALVRVCGNPLCVNPNHMIPADPRSRPSFPSPRGSFNRAKTCCPRGHDYAGVNLAVRKDGRRRCRRCAAEAAGRRRQ